MSFIGMVQTKSNVFILFGSVNVSKHLRVYQAPCLCRMQDEQANLALDTYSSATPCQLSHKCAFTFDKWEGLLLASVTNI